MANASKKSFGAGQQDQGKGSGSGAMSTLDPEDMPENEILSNRDKAQHSDQRGLDSRHVQNQQRHEHVGSQTKDNGDE